MLNARHLSKRGSVLMFSLFVAVRSRKGACSTAPSAQLLVTFTHSPNLSLGQVRGAFPHSPLSPSYQDHPSLGKVGRAGETMAVAG